MAVIIVPSDEETKKRITKKKEKKINYRQRLRITLPAEGSFDEIQFSELQREEAEKILQKYKDDAPLEIEKQKKEEKTAKRPYSYSYSSSFSSRRGFRGGLRGRGGNIIRGTSRGGIFAGRGRGFVPLPFRGAPYGQRDIRDVRAARLLTDPRNQVGSSTNRPLSIYDHQRSSSSSIQPQASRIVSQDPRFRNPQEGFIPAPTPQPGYHSTFKKQRTRELSPPPRYSSRPPSPPQVGLYPPFNPYSHFA